LDASFAFPLPSTEYGFRATEPFPSHARAT
jgi:hypothetical protein